MTIKNKHGLSRSIPRPKRRQIRENCKFGCVLCRAGIYQYEHIEPVFADAIMHDVSNICCLCASCHEAVTRGHIAKSTVRSKYETITSADRATVPPPTGPLDFSGSNAHVVVGDLGYAPYVRRVIVHSDTTVLSVLPGFAPGQPAHIRAVFCDEDGKPVLKLRDSTWVGDTSAWDLEVVGRTLTVRKKAGQIALELELHPPNSLVISRMDMRIADAHVLIANGKYVVGRYLDRSKIAWVRADLQIHQSTPLGTAIEFTSPDRLRTRDLALRPTSQYMAEPRGEFVMHAAAGALCIPHGICIGGLTGAFSLRGYAAGERSLEDVRKVIRSSPEDLMNFISRGNNGVLYEIT